MIVLRNKEFTSKAFKAVKRSAILKDIVAGDKGGGYVGHLKSAAKRGTNFNLVAEEAVELDRKLAKKGIEKSSRELSEGATVGTYRGLARGGYYNSKIVPYGKLKNGAYHRGSKDGEVVEMYKSLKKDYPESAKDLVKTRRELRNDSSKK